MVPSQFLVPAGQGVQPWPFLHTWASAVQSVVAPQCPSMHVRVALPTQSFSFGTQSVPITIVPPEPPPAAVPPLGFPLPPLAFPWPPVLLVPPPPSGPLPPPPGTTKPPLHK